MRFFKPKPKAGFFERLGEKLRAQPKQRYQSYVGDTEDWSRKCDEFDKYYNDNPEIKSQVLTIAGRATAKGVFLQERKDSERSLEAKKLCDELNRDIGMDQLLYETIPPLVKYGTALWEQSFAPDYDAQLLPIAKGYSPTKYDNYSISEWEILDENGFQRNPRILLSVEGNQAAEFSWNKTETSWPYGTSLLMGLGDTLETINQFLADLKEYMHRAAFPGGMFGVGDSENLPTPDQMDDIKSKIRNWTPGENYATSFPVTYNVVGPAAAETRILGESLVFLKERLIDGLMVAPISKQYQRSLASAETMDDVSVQALIIPIQRLLKRVLERQVYWPFLEQRNYSIKNVPSVSFIPPDEKREEQADYYLKLLQGGVMTKEAVARELGIALADVPMDEIKIQNPDGSIKGYKVSKDVGTRSQA